MNLIKYLYDWVLGWAHKPNGHRFLGILSFSEASVFPIPPDVLLIPLCLGHRRKSYIFAFTCSLFSILGAILGYYIGKVLWWDIPGLEYSYIANNFFKYVPGITIDGFNNIQAMYNQWNFWIVFTAGFTPIPFKLITISAGTFNINFLMFLIASIISRSARFFIVASLIKEFGDPIKEFIEKYFNLLALIFTILFIGGFIFIKYILP
jgi:membrane protein YqaA with SNARE-associated domain